MCAVVMHCVLLQFGTLLLSSIALHTTPVQANTPFDLVIEGGRVMDPETGFDGVRNVGIRAGKIVAISAQPLVGHRVIDARDHVVAPGFIDIHTHTPTPLGQQANVLDGITTHLDTEAGAFPVAAFGSLIQQTPLINFGASVGHYAARIKVIEGKDQPYFFHGDTAITMGSPAWEQVATKEQIEAMRTLLREGLLSGGLGIGVLLDYMRDAVSHAELAMIFKTAAEFNAPVFIHVRRNLPGDPAGLLEALELAEQTGAPVFICHLTHNAMGGVGDWLAAIDAARSRGVRVATETLSFLAGGTSISADVFRKRDWQAIFDITYEDVQWTATGEWLTKETWDYYVQHEPRGGVNHHYLKEPWLAQALAWPDMMVSTDALPAFTRDQQSNPNIAGTFSLLLGRYVRERGYLSLMDALARTSLKQAQWLESIAPVFANKGRLQVGKDADIVVFNPKTIAARASYQAPYAPPVGISWVVVNGELVVAENVVASHKHPGQRLLGSGQHERPAGPAQTPLMGS